MKTPIDDGGPAFPRAPFDVNDYCDDGSPGMPLRDWFAGMALQGIMGNTLAFSQMKDDQIASCSYQAADAMLAARKGVAQAL